MRILSFCAPRLQHKIMCDGSRLLTVCDKIFFLLRYSMDLFLVNRTEISARHRLFYLEGAFKYQSLHIFGRFCL